MKFSRISVLSGAMLCGILALIVAVYALRPHPQILPALSQDGPDLLEVRVLEIAGKTAIDCGTVKVHASPKIATDCALAANTAGKPFHVRYAIMGIDSQVAIAIVRAPSGKVSALMYDSDISGHGGRGAESVNIKPCPEPLHLWVNPAGRINCFQQQSSPPKDAMSPNSEPY